MATPLGILRENLRSLRTEPITPVERILAAWTALTIRDMKQGLRSKGRRSSGALEASIAPRPITTDDQGNLFVEIEMEDYWDFINQGVNGIRMDWGSEYLYRKTANTPSSGGLTFPQSIQRWIAEQGIQSLSWTDKNTGEVVTKFLKTEEDFIQASFVIMRGVKKHGIEPSFFVDNALTDDSLDELADGIAEAYLEQIVKGL